MLPRPPQPMQGFTLRRAYSFFSNKSGNGRYFNSTRPGKPITKATTTGPQSTTPATGKDAAASPEEVKIPPSPSPRLRELEPPTASSSWASFTSEEQHLHPTPNLPTYHLHNFFSMDRPLLLLSQPVSTLFDNAPLSSLGASPSENFSANTDVTEDPEADVNAARMLARSLVMQRVRSSIDWAAVTSRLGIQSTDEAIATHVEMDSVNRKRKKKMTKHRYKKRRKLQRAERRRLGK